MKKEIVMKKEKRDKVIDGLFITSIFGFISIVGGGLYEAINVYPAMIDGPPKSMAIFQGDHAIKLHPFWIFIHSISEIAIIGLIVLLWKNFPRIKKQLLIAFSIHMILRLATFIYFAPEIIEITETPVQPHVDPELNSRLNWWLILGNLRTPASILVAYLIVKADRIYRIQKACANPV